LSDDNVTFLNQATTLPVPVERVASEASKGCPEHLLCIGWDADGELYLAASFADRRETLWLLELAKRKLFEYTGEGRD